MALTTVLTTDTFEQWRVKDNQNIAFLDAVKSAAVPHADISSIFSAALGAAESVKNIVPAIDGLNNRFIQLSISGKNKLVSTVILKKDTFYAATSSRLFRNDTMGIPLLGVVG
ncbi:MAG: hypothetical protein R8M45_03915 [Ghiorsea sp.]